MGKEENVGGDLFVQFRGDEGYSGLNLEDRYQNKVYIHLARKMFSQSIGRGTELWATLSAGEIWSDAALGLAIYVCEIHGDWANVSVAEDDVTARQRCPTQQSTTTTPYVIHRCGFTEMPSMRIGGFVWNWVYDILEEAMVVCDQEISCTGIYQAQPSGKFEVRTGSRWGWASSNAMSWACRGYEANGDMIGGRRLGLSARRSLEDFDTMPIKFA